MEYIDAVKERKVSMGQVKMVGEDDDTIRIMTIHKSKGLEFPVVVLADLNRSFNRQDLDRPVLVHPQLGVGAERVETERRIRYDTVSKSALALTLEREAKAEELRILYVAMTRAQEKLIMVCSRKNPEKHLRELAALPVPPEAVSGANCPGDWLLLTLLNTFQASELHGFAGVRPSELTEAPAGVTVHLHRIGGEETEGVASPAEEDAGESPDTTPDTASLGFVYGHRAATVTPSKVTATQLKGRAIDEEIAEGTLPRRRESAPERPRFLQEKRGLTGAERGTAMHLVMQFLPLDTAALEWRYPYEPETTLSAKLTATQLKGRALDEEIAENAPLPPRLRSLAKPRFLEGAAALTPAEQGTAMHAALQFLDFSTPAEEGAVRAAVKSMEERRLLTPEQARAVDAAALTRFLQSPLCARIRAAGERARREYRFSLLESAARFVPEASAGDEILLQGVVDCFFEEDGTLVVVDFKTDRVAPDALAERAEHYRPQLEAYSLALAQVIGKPVKEKILYFLRRGEQIIL